MLRGSSPSQPFPRDVMDSDPFLSPDPKQNPKSMKRGLSFHVASLAILILLPWLVFTTVTCLLTFAYHHFRVLVWVFIFLGAALSVLFIAVSSRNPRGPIYLFLGVLCVFAVMVSTVVGLYNYHEFAIQFWVIEEGRAPVNVRADEPSAGHSDAGRLSFAEDAHVDTERAVGYRDSSGTIYCVAPVVGSEDPDSVGYWAAGEDCCKQRADFTCDEALNPKARSGVVLIDRSPFVPSSREKFQKAAEESAGSFDLKVGKHPIFLKWVTDTQTVQDEYWNRCLVFLIFACVVHLLISVVFGFVLHFSSGFRLPKGLQMQR